MAVKNGTLKSEKIIGTAQADTIKGFQGTDTLSGGLGNDFIDGGVDNDLLNGEDGDDNLLGDEGDDTLQGGGGNDTLDGGQDNDKLFGNAGDDTLDGSFGVDTLTGGDGNDYYFVDNSKDIVIETNKTLKSGGNDTVETELLTYKLTENVENLVLAGIEAGKGFGNKGNNIITGNLADNVLNGDSGNDSLVGGAGVDTLDGGLGVDTLVGGDDSDVYYMNNTQDKIVENETGGELDQINATVTFNLNSAPNVEALELSGAKATAGTGNELNNLIQEIDGGKVSVNLKGMKGEDTLIGGSGNDTLDGGAGNDTAIFNNLKDKYEITTNVDTDGVNQIVVKYVGNTTSKLDEGEDILTNIEFVQFSDGTSLNATDILAGDTTEGGSGSDTTGGGTGEDTVSGGSVTPVIPALPTALPKDKRAYDYELPLTDDADSLDGSPMNEKFLGLGGNDVLHGKEGNDYLDGGTGDDALYGEAGDDYILAGNGADWVGGSWGNDSIDGGAGNNQLFGEAGDDFLVAGDGNNSMSGGDGNDELNAGEGNDTLDGGIGNDKLNAGNGNNSVNGGDWSDIITTGSGNDSIDGGGYNDSIESGAGNDTVNSSSGFDTINAGNGDDVVHGYSTDTSDYYGWSISTWGVDGNNVGNILVHGGNGNDDIRSTYYNSSINAPIQNLYGDAGDDTIVGLGNLFGGVGNDYLQGGTYLNGDEGYDTLQGIKGWNQTFNGGADADRINTDGGADTIQYSKITDSKVGAGNRDIISDFDTGSGDVLQVYQLSDKALSFLAMKAFDGGKGEVRFNIDAPNKQTVVQIDMNGDKVADMEIELTGIKILSADDFVLVKPV